MRATPAFLALLLAAPLAAQWLNYPTAGVPRNTAGAPDLKAPAPKSSDGKPDFSGMWVPADPLPCDGINRVCTDLPISRQFGNIGAGLEGGLPYSAWAREEIKRRATQIDPYSRCISPGGPRMHLLPTMKKIVQTPRLMAILDEYNATYRQIFIDGRPLPEDPQPGWMGYSSARWEGDALVVDSLGYRDDQWLDAARSPLTGAARVTERFRRPNYGTLEIEITVNDPKAYTRPWTVLVRQVAVPDTEMLDSICLENEKDVPHLPGK
ncbi:MAG: hypothetical protein C5B51_02570 [Terriglobia bacterium]|nr:MAG: hypothetical protein C5B51_02570 [Terriglobia bacterium]